MPIRREPRRRAVQLGKQFVVNAVMAGPAWQRTLLIWFYDEHGGYYDHVLPPAAIAPDDIAPDIGPGDQSGGYNPGLVQGYQGQPLPAFIADLDRAVPRLRRPPPRRTAVGRARKVCDTAVRDWRHGRAHGEDRGCARKT